MAPLDTGKVPDEPDPARDKVPVDCGREQTEKRRLDLDENELRRSHGVPSRDEYQRRYMAALAAQTDQRPGRAHLTDTHDHPRSQQQPAGRGGDHHATAPERRPDREPATDSPTYWDNVPRFQRMWADHIRRWPRPEQSDTPNQRATPDASSTQRPITDRTTETMTRARPDLGPDDFERIDQAIRRIPEAEKTISDDMRAVERANTSGARLEGFQFRRKGEDRLKEKIIERLEHQPQTRPEHILREIPDAIRYTFCFDPANYVKGYYDVTERLRRFGYEMYKSKNFWSAPEYRGINTQWVTPAGQRFEVQFHTPESFNAKHDITHQAYERIRDPDTSNIERRQLHAFQREVTSWIRVPEGAAEIPDVTKEGF